MKNLHRNIRFYNIGVILSLICSYFVSYMLGIILFLSFSLLSRYVSKLGYIYVILAISVISFTNYSDWQQGDYDIVRYYNVWSLFADAKHINDAWGILLDMRADFLFYFIEYVLTLIFPSDPRWFGFVFTTLISTLLFLSLRNVVINETCEMLMQKRTTLILFGLAFFGVIRFYDFTNIFRQHFAFALFLYAITSNWSKTAKMIFCVFTVFMHWSMVLYLIFYVFFKKDLRYKSKVQLLFVFLLIGVCGVPLFIYVLSSYSYVVDYFLREELGVDKKIMAIMSISVLLFFYIVKNLCLAENIQKLAFITVILSCLFITRSTLTLRMSYNFTDMMLVMSPVFFYKSRLINFRGGDFCPLYLDNVCII